MITLLCGVNNVCRYNTDNDVSIREGRVNMGLQGYKIIERGWCPLVIPGMTT